MWMTSLPWIVLFPAIVLLLSEKMRPVATVMLVCAYIIAFAVGQLNALALVPVSLLILAGYAVRPDKPSLARIAGHILFIGLVIVLRMHWAPGFNNPLVVSEHLGTGATLTRIYLNLDKTLIAFWIMLAWPHLELKIPTRTWLKSGAVIGLATAALCISGGLVLEMVRWDPKWPESAWIWAANNLLLVCLTEELLFRGYIQEGLGRLLAKYRYGDWLALGVASLLFGLAHVGSGGLMILMSTIAGVGYGMAYRRGGLQAAVLAHAVLNLLHFAFFTYPMLAAV